MFITYLQQSATFVVLIHTNKKASYHLCQGISYPHSDFSGVQSVPVGKWGAHVGEVCCGTVLHV